jgi:hypothetical protein
MEKEVCEILEKKRRVESQVGSGGNSSVSTPTSHTSTSKRGGTCLGFGAVALGLFERFGSISRSGRWVTHIVRG